MKRPYIILALYIVVRNYSTSRELTKRIHRFMKSIGKSVLFRQSPLEHFQFVDRIHSTKSEHILYKRFIIVIVDCLAPHHIIEHLVSIKTAVKPRITQQFKNQSERIYVE